MMGTPPFNPLRTRRLLRLGTLVYFYRRRLRAHGTQELLAGVGIAAAVALVLAAGVAQQSIGGSTRRVERAVVGPADLQLRARGPDGFSETMLAHVAALPGVKNAAPLLERSIWITGPSGHSDAVYVAGTDVSLAVLNGLGRTLPLDALSHGAIGLSQQSASALGVPPSAAGTRVGVSLTVGGVRHQMRVSAVLGNEAVGALSEASVGVMPLSSMQQLLSEPGRITRILVQSAPGHRARVAAELHALADPRLIVGGTNEDVGQLTQALRPSGQASELFAVIGALLGFLFAFNAILLTVPERREAIADLRLSGTTRSAIVQLTSFQGLCLGIAASALGLAVGYVLSRWVFHQSTGYLAEAFTLSGGTIVKARTVLLAGVGGVLVTLLACAMPLIDLRRGNPPDGIYLRPGVRSGHREGRGLVWMSLASLALLCLSSVLYAAAPASALAASITLAIGTVLAVPVAFAGILALARALSERLPHLSSLALALSGVRGTTMRSLALAATGAVALFGSIGLGGARSNLLGGIRSFAHSYAADAPIWVGEPGDNQATHPLAGDGGASIIGRLSGVGSVERFQGAFLAVGARRVWVLARPAGGANHVLADETLGAAGSQQAGRRLGQGGWIVVSEQLASEHHTRPGETMTLPTPTGPRSYRVASLATNLAWTPGVVIMGTRDFTAAWGSDAPSALAIRPATGVSVPMLIEQIRHALGPSNGREIVSAATREGKINVLTSEGLSQLGLISTLLILTAVVALAAALASSINQRRAVLASLRLAGAAPARLRRILLLEAVLMLAAGCVTGAVAGVYGQFVIDAYLRSVTGFPVQGAGASVRPVEIFVAVLAAALAVVAFPTWWASRVSPSLALTEE
jgi:putative ABC transport system permease protein